MIQQIARTTFPLFRSDNNNNNDRDRSDGFLVNRCLSFRKKNSTLLFRKNYKNKKAEDDNQIHKPKQSTSSRSDTNTVTQLTPSPNYAVRPIISDRVQREQETGSSNIPTVPELRSTPPKLFNNSSNSSSRRRRQRLTSIAYSSRRSSSSSLSASHEVLLRHRSSSSSSRQQSITDDGDDDGDFNEIEPLLDPNTHTQDQEQQVEVEDEDEDNADFLVVKDATSLLFPPPPIEYVEIPEDFTHATALQDNKSNNNTKSNSSTSANLLALNRPPRRLSDWDDWDEQTIESNSEELVQLKTDTNNRGVVSSIASLSSAAKKVAVRNALTDRRQRRIRSILQVSHHSNSPQRRMASSALVDKTTTTTNDSSENNEEHEEEEQGLLRSPRRVVKWNMVQQPPRSPQPQPRVVNWNMVQQPPSPQQQQQHQALEQQSQQPRVVKWNMIR